MQLPDVVGNEVGQVAVLGLVPYVLDGIEVGGVGRQPLHLEPVAARLFQATYGRTMDRPAVTHQQ